MSAIEVNDLYKEFSTPTGVEVAVNGISFNIGENEFFTVVGPSGCGKTTTLRCIAGLETPTSGNVLFDGQDLTEVPPHKRNIAMMFQNIALYPHMTMVDNISYPLKVRNVSKEQRYEQARKAAETMQIEELLDKYPGELSGGQRQRGALARTIVQSPKAFLMDEPLSDLDAKLKIQMRKEIQRIHDYVNRPTIYVTHDQAEAMTMSDRIAVMNDGDIEQIGTPDELYEKPNNRFIAEFIGSPSMNFIECDIDSSTEGEISFQTNDQIFTLPQEKIPSLDGYSSVVIGFRPESVELRSNGYLPATVQIVERLDDRLLITMDCSGKEIQATISAEQDVEESDTVEVWFDEQQSHFFDPNTLERLS